MEKTPRWAWTARPSSLQSVVVTTETSACSTIVARDVDAVLSRDQLRLVFTLVMMKTTTTTTTTTIIHMLTSCLFLRSGIAVASIHDQVLSQPQDETGYRKRRSSKETT